MRQKQRKKFVLGSIQKDILQHLTTRDLLLSFLLSARSTRAFYREAYKRARARYRSKRSVESLEKIGLLARHGDMVGLTEKGKELMRVLASQVTLPENEWRGNWWIVMYDIPVSMNSFRFELRRLLVRAGFRKLQHSVWIRPHPCMELELFLKGNQRLAKYVRVLEAPPFAYLRTMRDWKNLAT